MASYLPQETFDTLMFSYAMMKLTPRVDEQAQYSDQCVVYLKTFKAESHEALVRSREQLTPMIEERVDHICNEIYASEGGHRPEHRLAILRLMLSGLHTMHDERKPSLWARITDPVKRPDRQFDQVRNIQSAANIVAAADLVLRKTSLQKCRAKAS